MVLHRDGVQGGFDLEGGELGVFLEQKSNDPDDMRAGKAIPRQVLISPADPRRTDVHARGGQLDHLAEPEPEVQRVGLLALDHRY